MIFLSIGFFLYRKHMCTDHLTLSIYIRKENNSVVEIKLQTLRFQEKIIAQIFM